jgi:hypothetical protein
MVESILLNSFEDFYKEFKDTLLKNVDKPAAKVIFRQGWMYHVEYMLKEIAEGRIKIDKVE